MEIFVPQKMLCIIKRGLSSVLADLVFRKMQLEKSKT